jgi:hypothetical protein
MKPLPVLSVISLVLLGSCSTVDLSQAELAKRSPRRSSPGATRQPASKPTERAHAVITTVLPSERNGAAAQHRVLCSFQSSCQKNEDQMELALVSSDVE